MDDPEQHNVAMMPLRLLNLSMFVICGVVSLDGVTCEKVVKGNFFEYSTCGAGERVCVLMHSFILLTLPPKTKIKKKQMKLVMLN